MMTTHGEVDRLLIYMPIITRAGGINEWERKFCISIAGRMKRGAFVPTEKQIATMKRIVGDFQDQTMGDDVVELGHEIER